MACGYGACYGCVVELDGRLQRLCVAGPVLRGGRHDGVSGVRSSTRSGCLDALTAPDVARTARRVRDEDHHPAAARGQPARADRGDRDAGCSTRSGCRGPASRRSWRARCRRLAARRSVSGSRSAGSRRTTSPASASASTSVPTSTTIELNLSCPNVEEAPETVGADRRRLPRRDVASRSTRSSHLPRGTSPSRRAPSSPPAPTASRSSTRSAGWRSSRARCGPCSPAASGGYSGPALKPIALACVSACAAAVDVPIVGMGGVRSGLDALELVAAGASVVSLGTVLFADPAAPDRVRDELARAKRGARVRRIRSTRVERLPIVVSKKYLQIGENSSA